MFSFAKAKTYVSRLMVGLTLVVAFGVAVPEAPAAPVKKPAKGEVKKKKKKKSVQRGLKARSKKRKSARKLVEQETLQDEASVKPRHVFIGFVGLALLVLMFRHRKEEAAEAAPERDVSNVHKPGRMLHEPRAVILDPMAGIDPATAEMTQANAQAENAAVAEEIDRLTTGDLKLRLSNHGAPAEIPKIEVRRPAGEKLPGVFAEHFEAMPNETVQWTATFKVPGVTDGSIGLTNRRLVVVHEDRRLGFMPPAYSKELRRHQTPFSQIAAVEESATKRPIFLAAGVLTCLFYPVGTALSCVAIGCYFAVHRPVLCVTTSVAGNQQRRYYPLLRADILEAKRMISQLTGRSGDAAAPADDKKKAG